MHMHESTIWTMVARHQPNHKRIYQMYFNDWPCPKAFWGGRPGIYCMCMRQPFRKTVRKSICTLIPTTC